jgi:hypothetical protein
MQAMNDTRQAHADLAFMKALVEEGPRSQMMGGAAFLAGGLLYGFQCLVHWTQFVGITRLSDVFMLVFVIAITIAFLVVLGVVIWRDRRTGQRGVGTRALNAAFGGAGLANLVLCGVFGFVAWRESSQRIWLLYPVTICVVQGFAWYVAYMMRKRLWLALVSVGWYATAVGLGLLIGNVAGYVLLLAAALLLLMALPGGVMMRMASKSA